MTQTFRDGTLEWQQFRQIVHEVYHSDKESYARAGGDAGHLWRFIREMKEGDRVLVPHGAEFYTAEVVGVVPHATVDRS